LRYSSLDATRHALTSKRFVVRDFHQSDAVLTVLLTQLYDAPRPLNGLVHADRVKEIGNHLQSAGLAFVLNGVARITQEGRLFVEKARRRQA
jgi:hypothetical protein